LSGKHNETPTNPLKQSFSGLRLVLIVSLGCALSLSVGGNSQAEENANVDVLVLYTSGAEALYADVNTRINQIVSVSNQIFSDSGVDMQLRLVHTERVNFSDSVNSIEALRSVTSPYISPLANQAASLREAHGADFVVFMRPYARDGYCGVAWVLGNRTGGQFSDYDARMAFSHVSINCSNYVMAHELGHNMGLAHSYEQNNRGYTYPYSIGHGAQGEFVTVMAYGSAYSTHRKIYKFSNAEQNDCNGQRCGTPHDGAMGADAAKSLQQTRAAFEGFTAEVGTVPPPLSVEMIFPTRQTRELRQNEEIEIQWNASETVSGVTVQYRRYWRKRGKWRAGRRWMTIGNDVVSGTQSWVVTGRPLRRFNKVQFRLIASGPDGDEELMVTSRKIRIKN
jgi:hypothetical protein